MASRPGPARTPGAKRTSRPIVGLLLAGLLGLLFGCSPSAPEQRPGATNVRGPAQRPSGETLVPFDVGPLLKPPRKYLGAALDGAPESLAPVRDFAGKIGKQPNLLEYYVAWG